MKNKIITAFCILLFGGAFIANLIIPDKKISSTERRYLQQFKNPTTKTLLNKNFMDNFDNYTVDQFLLRDQFLESKSFIETNFLRKKDNDGFFSYNNYVLKMDYKLNEKSLQNMTNLMNKIISNNLTADNKVFTSVIPDKNYYLEDNKYLKMDYNKVFNAFKNIEGATYIDLTNELKMEDYYYSDIHFDQSKILNAANKVRKTLGFDEDVNYKTNKIDGFKGAYYSGLPSNKKVDTITYLTNKNIEEATVFNYGTNKKSTVYNLANTKNIDMYDIFLDGPTSIIKITNEHAQSDRELIYFRDSFGSSLSPLLINDYKTITLVDLRYVRSVMLDEFIEFDNQDILFAYSTPIINNSFTFR